MSDPYELFTGLGVWGLEFLPKDIYFSLNELREWAFRDGLIDEPEFQLVTPERIEELKKLFTTEDRLLILVELSPSPTHRLTYLEYVYVPVITLIKKGFGVDLVWWRLVPNAWDSAGRVKEYGFVQFGFWLTESTEEFCSESHAKLIVEKFKEWSGQVDRDYYRVKELRQGVLEVEVDGDVKARFFKVGRRFDVELSWISDEEKQRKLEALRRLREEIGGL